MHHFAEQCLDIARSILSHNLDSINENGSIMPIHGEQTLINESGHAAMAIGEFYSTTGEVSLGEYDLIDLAARSLTAQVFDENESENGLAYATLGLLSFGPSKERNVVWERLLDSTRELLDRRLLTRCDYHNHFQVFNVAKTVGRFSLGLSKKDDTGKVIDQFIEHVKTNSSTGFLDDNPQGLGGVFDIQGIFAFTFIRQALQLHANLSLKDRKLPSLRTLAQQYLRFILDIVRADGLGWCYGSGVGAYGQMHCISLILQAMHDGWIPDDQAPMYWDTVKRLFHFLFASYLDQEHGYVVVRDAERTMGDNYTTRMANFDMARYLCQWVKLAKELTIPNVVNPPTAKPTCRFIVFDKSNKKEQGLFVYNDPASKMQIQLPLASNGIARSSDSLAFPHCPGVFDWPVNQYLPILLPELTFGETVCIPAFYGKRCVTGLGLGNAFYFSYEQPELITIDEVLTSGLGSCKVVWTFQGSKVNSEFTFIFKNAIQLDRLRYTLAISSPHSQYHVGSSLSLGEESLGAIVTKDDFNAAWQETEVVSEDPAYKTYYGKLHYIQTLARTEPLMLRPNVPYRLVISFKPDLITLNNNV